MKLDPEKMFEFLKRFNPKPLISKSNSSQSLPPLDFFSASLLWNSLSRIEQATSGSQMLISFAHHIHQPLLLRFTVCGVYGFFLLLFLKLSSLFPFPQTHLHNPSFRAISGSHSVSPLKRLFCLRFLFFSNCLGVYTSACIQAPFMYFGLAFRSGLSHRIIFGFI